MPTREPRPGPSWVGIGAQRSGTTWFTDLVTAHPDVVLPERKELHFFDRFLVDDWSAAAAAEYRALFAGPGAGEFTPSYLRLPWVPRLLREACGDEPPLVVVLLRDPLERLESAIRWQMRREPVDEQTSLHDRTVRPLAWWESAVTGSAYGSQLAAWRDEVGADTMMVLQYEAVCRDPVAAVSAFWRRLGLAPRALPDVAAPSRTSTRPSRWSLPSHWQPRLVDHLAADVEQALSEWDLEVSQWPRWQAATTERASTGRSAGQGWPWALGCRGDDEPKGRHDHAG